MESGRICSTRIKALVMILLFTTPCHHLYAGALSSLAKNDPYPIYTSLDPQEYLFTREKIMIKGFPLLLPYPQYMSFSLSPFGQNACGGKNFCGKRVPLGDLDGRWNMLGLLYDPLPEGRVLPPRLQTAKDIIFPPGSMGPVTPDILDDGRFVDPAHLFGFFSVPLDYKKRGFRFQFSTMLSCTVGIIFEGGVSDIVQKVVGFDNLTCQICSEYEDRINPCLPPPCCDRIRLEPCETTTSCPTIQPLCTYSVTGPILCCNRENLFPNCASTEPNPSSANLTCQNVNKLLMYELATIAKEIGLDICNFHDTSIEDIRLRLFWRDAFYINKGLAGWAEFLLIPYAELGGTIGIAKAKKPNVAFSLPFGNNGHSSLGGAVGINFDFIETIEIGAEAGITHFFSRDICDFRIPNGVPTRECQLGIYPFTTDVRVDPGLNWHFGAKMQAYHFLDRLSVYIQYLLIHHENDTITLKKPDPAFRPKILEKSSYWTAQIANIGFNYDISPSMSLGVLWQAPLSQRNAYRTSTVLFSFSGTY